MSFMELAKNRYSERYFDTNRPVEQEKGGCFWGTQKFFDQFEGVKSTEVGYADGSDKEPT